MIEIDAKPPENIEEIKSFISMMMVEAAKRQKYRDAAELARVLRQFHKMDASSSSDPLDSMSVDEMSKEVQRLLGGK